MPAFDDAADYLDDFGVECVAGTTAFRALFDQEDVEVQLADVGAVSRAWRLTYATAAVTLQRTALVSVEGVDYKVREVPRQLGDGTFAEAVLTKV